MLGRFRVFRQSTQLTQLRKMSKVQIGKKAPDFTNDAVVGDQFTKVSLKDYAGKYLVVFFYPLDFTFVCPTEILAFNDAADKFKKLNTELLAVSCDSKFSHLAWTKLERKKGGLGKLHIPLVADFAKKMATDYGVLINDGEDEGATWRGLFIIDPEQNVRQITINDLPVGRSVDETLRLIEAFQFVAEHGEVCPANWKKGDLTMKASPKESLEYFEKKN
jgi:alkyl hydroperoxide reductase subunit AhpC